MSQPRRLPWREVVLVNGVVSGLLGLIALAAVRMYGRRVDAWARGQSPEVVQEAAEVIALVYLAYALGLVTAALLAFFVPGWCGRRSATSPVTASDRVAEPLSRSTDGSETAPGGERHPPSS